MEIGFLAAMTAAGGDITAIARATEAAGFDSLWNPGASRHTGRHEDAVPLHARRQTARSLWPLG